MHYALLFIIIESRFWIICLVLDIRRFGFGSEISPELIFGLDLDFRFGLWVWVLSHYIRSESDPLPSLTKVCICITKPSHYVQTSKIFAAFSC
jgi:hypothetical protein